MPTAHCGNLGVDAISMWSPILVDIKVEASHHKIHRSGCCSVAYTTGCQGLVGNVRRLLLSRKCSGVGLMGMPGCPAVRIANKYLVDRLAATPVG